MTSSDSGPTPDPHTDDDEPPAPHRGLRGFIGRPVWRELRVPFERRALTRDDIWRGHGLPAGNGRPVLIIPGFFSGPHKAAPLARILDLAGWDVEVAAVGRNAGPAYDAVDAATADLQKLHDRSAQRVAVVGHSRGGQFGRVLAVRHPDLISRVIAVTAPLRTKYPPYLLVKLPAETLDRMYRAGLFGPVHPDREQVVDEHRYADLSDEVDLVSIFSRSDGLVDWRHSFDSRARMVEVDATHLGVMQSVAGIRCIAAELDRPHAAASGEGFVDQ